jgi:hypothetical protein
LLIGILGGAATLGVKPRVPILPAERRGPAPPLNFRFLSSPVFLAVVGPLPYYHLDLGNQLNAGILAGDNHLLARACLLPCIVVYPDLCGLSRVLPREWNHRLGRL